MGAKGKEMKQKTVFLILGFILAATLRAEDLKPPVPAGDSTDLLPPPVDISQLTPLPLPGDSKPEPVKDNQTAPPPPPTAKSDTQKKVAEPTATPILAKTETKKKVVEPVPTATAKPAPAGSRPAATISIGAFADYFPYAKGTRWTYEYLKAEAGSKVKKNRMVECVSQETAANGGVNVTFQVTEDGQITNEKYSLANDQVEHIGTGGQSFSGDFVYKYPSAGETTNWIVTDPNGGIHKSKASFGKAQVYKKVYPDCVIVAEKTGATTIFYYYAKGRGLVSMEVYGKGMKLALTKSFALVSGPTTP